MKKIKIRRSTIHASSKLAKAHGKKLVKPNFYLETQKKHKHWYLPDVMGKQRGKPRYDMAGKKIKKREQ